jgi:hypothetical protein
MATLTPALAIVFPEFHRRPTIGTFHIIDIVWLPEHGVLSRTANVIALHGSTSPEYCLYFTPGLEEIALTYVKVLGYI